MAGFCILAETRLIPLCHPCTRQNIKSRHTSIKSASLLRELSALSEWRLVKGFKFWPCNCFDAGSLLSKITRIPGIRQWIIVSFHVLDGLFHLRSS